MTPEFIIGDLVEYISYTDPTDNYTELPITAVITGFYDHDTLEELGNDYTTHDRVIYANILSDRGEFTALLTELALLSSVPRC
jgi:hypothetical protein